MQSGGFYVIDAQRRLTGSTDSAVTASLHGAAGVRAGNSRHCLICRAEQKGVLKCARPSPGTLIRVSRIRTHRETHFILDFTGIYGFRQYICKGKESSSMVLYETKYETYIERMY